MRQVVRSTDPRSAAVRERLCAAAEELGHERADISVTSLVRRAGVSRSVFYKHFEGLGDFALYLQRTRLASIADVAAETTRELGDVPQGIFRAHQRLIAHFEENWSLYQAVVGMTAPGVSERGLAEVLAEALDSHLGVLGEIPPHVDVKLTSYFVSSGVASVLVSWLRGELSAEPDDLVRHLTDLVPLWMRGASDPARQPADGR